MLELDVYPADVYPVYD